MRATPLLVLLVLAVAGCAAPGSRDEDAAAPSPRCVHPWPCGDEWPEELAGPFDVEAQPVRIPMSDGVELAAWAHVPLLPEEVRAPVVVYASPYVASCSHPIQTGGVPTCWPDGDDLEGQATHLRERLADLPPRGFAVLVVSVRGTGFSGGCFDYWGPTETRDSKEIVEWAAAQPWSNGRVAMYGVSYMGTTPWQAAIQAPEALKTIVVGGIITDVYQVQFSPQGAPVAFGAATAFEGSFAGAVSAGPFGAPGSLPEFLPDAARNACPETATHQSAYELPSLGADRDAAYFEPRNYALRLPDVTAAIFVAQGLEEGSVHGRQDDIVWAAAANAPKRMIHGQWGHTFPTPEDLQDYPGGADWTEILVAWLDFWLKGVGDAPPRLGVVDHERSDGAWASSTAWPPVEGKPLAAYLTPEGFASTPGSASLALRAVPAATVPLCARADDAVVVSTPPLETELVLAGNPMAYLELESDLPAGGLHAYLLDVAGEGCDAGFETLAQAAADLRFHEGGYAGRDFPTGTPTPVRLDFWGISHVVAPGHRLALVLTGPGDSFTPPAPALTLRPESHLVLPVVAGPIAGGPPLAEYPPRPFAPPGVG